MQVNNAAEAQAIQPVESAETSQTASQVGNAVQNSPEAGLSSDSNLSQANAGVASTAAEAANGVMQTGDTGLADERGDALTYELANEVVDDAVLSLDSYNDSIGEDAQALGYSRMSADELSSLVGEDVVLDDPDTGFSASVYEGPDGSITAAFRGSEANDLNDIGTDWLQTNFGQAFGSEVPEAYQQASALAGQLANAFGNDVQLTGHSLGGGMANYAAIDNNLDYNAFNAAGLSNNTVESLGDKVDNYTGTGNVINDEYDPLTNYGGGYNAETWGNGAQHVGHENLVFMNNDDFSALDAVFNFGKRVDAHNLAYVLPALAQATGKDNIIS